MMHLGPYSTGLRHDVSKTLGNTSGRMVTPVLGGRRDSLTWREDCGGIWGLLPIFGVNDPALWRRLARSSQQGRLGLLRQRRETKKEKPSQYVTATARAGLELLYNILNIILLLEHL